MRRWLQLCGALAPLSLLAAPLRIENAVVSVRYNESAGRFSCAVKSSDRPFAVDGKLDGVAKSAAAEDATDPVFGAGRRIAVTKSDGSVASLELYPDLPFVLIRGMRHNDGTNAITVAKCVPATFTLDLGKPASELRTMGTAGLLAPDRNPGSYVFLTCADPATRRGVVAGWVTHDRGDGVLFSEVKEGRVGFKAQIDYGRLLIESGQSAALETLAVGVFDDARIGQELFADAIKKHYDIRLRPRSPGFCTWYSEVGGLTDKKGGAGALNEKDIVTLTEFAAKELKPFGFGFVQIDDEWQDGASNPDGSRINGPRRGFTRHKPDGPYPQGMAATAEMIERNGLTAGIWILPFARNHQDPEYKDRQDWFIKRLDGKPYETVWGGTSLDLTHPAVQAHLVELAKTLKGWGFDYFKMDGLWTGSATEQIYVNDGYKDDQIGNNAPFRDPRVTNIEAMRSGLKLLRQAAGPKVYFSGCCASQNMRSLGGAMGLVDSMRVGPDNGFEWQDYRKEVMHFEGGGIITGPIRANRLYFLNGRVWWNDPDPAYVRPAVKLNHAQLLASWIAVAGAFDLNSDWLPGLPPERLDILKRCMPSHQAQARPVDYFDTTMPSIWLLTDARTAVRRDVLGLYNWDSEPRAVGYDAAKSGLDGTATYHAFDFWGNAPLPDFKGAFKIDVAAEACRIVAVRKAEGRPVLVSTSRHVTQGIVDVREETWSAGTLSGVSEVVANDPYELRIAGIGGSSGWKFVKASVSPEDANAGVTIQAAQARPGEEGWQRLILRGNTENRPVRWSVSFAPAAR
jgi:hypothetical protein